MIEIKNTCYKGTRILLGNEKRKLINSMVDLLISEGFEEISIPIIQLEEYFQNKVGKENSNMMFRFTDPGNRKVCLAPEYTAIIQQLAETRFKLEKDLKLFYIQECFRGEKPQTGRYRQFTQLGVEVINPKEYKIEDAANLAKKLLSYFKFDFQINLDATRGLDYYKNGKGFEISCETLGAQKQICGGGEYNGGLGFALGIDRLLLLK